MDQRWIQTDVGGGGGGDPLRGTTPQTERASPHQVGQHLHAEAVYVAAWVLITGNGPMG